MSSNADSLPPGWLLAPLESLAADEKYSLTDGPFGSNLKTAHYTASGPRVIRLQNVGEMEFVAGEAHISEDHFNRLRRHEARAGDIVIGLLGQSLPRACLVPGGLGPAIVKADCPRLRANQDAVVPKYAMYCLNSYQARRAASAMIHGVGRPRLNLKDLRRLNLPTAPLPEQHRIVEAIETQFTRLDAAIETLKRVQTNLKRYRASVLKAAVEGRLVPTEAELARQEGREYEPASVLLERILEERRRRWEEAELAKMKAKGKEPKNDKWKAKYKEPAEPDTEGLPELPEGWCWATLSQLLILPLTNGRSVQTAQVGFPVLRLTALRSGGVDLRERKIGAWSKEEAERFLVKKGDFLISRGNGSLRLVGRGGLVEQEPAPVAFPDTLIRVSVSSSAIFPRLLSAFWNSPGIRRQIESSAKTTAGIYKVNQKDLSRVLLPLPPRQEQELVLEDLEGRLSVTDSARQLVELSLARCHRLRQSILKWAFEGKLVDQDPNDEPAAELLARIRRESNETETTSRRRNKSPKQRTAPSEQDLFAEESQ